MPKPRGVIIAGNWKMNHLPQETQAFFEALGRETFSKSANSSVQALIFPPFLSLSSALKGSQEISLPVAVQVGAQNASGDPSGAFTGEISAAMLKDLGIRWILIGHSERRHVFGESNAVIAHRVSGLLEQGMKVMLCIGETREERESGKMNAVLSEQLTRAVSNAQALQSGQLVIAYEPVWAIGTGLTATPEQAEEAHKFVRKWLWDQFGMETAGKVSILYGGSVKTDNIKGLLQCPNIDGALVGGASLNPSDFAKLLAAAL